MHGFLPPPPSFTPVAIYISRWEGREGVGFVDTTVVGRALPAGRHFQGEAGAERRQEEARLG